MKESAQIFLSYPEQDRERVAAIRLVTKSDTRGWLRHCGYKVASA